MNFMTKLMMRSFLMRNVDFVYGRFYLQLESQPIQKEIGKYSFIVCEDASITGFHRHLKKNTRYKLHIKYKKSIWKRKNILNRWNRKLNKLSFNKLIQMDSCKVMHRTVNVYSLIAFNKKEEITMCNVTFLLRLKSNWLKKYYLF